MIWTNSEIEYLTNNYGKIKIHDMEKILHRNEKAIRTKGERLGLKTSFTNKKYTIDPLSFDKITLDSCYWAGFIAADGCLCKSSKNCTRLIFGQKFSDKCILDAFNQYTSSSYPVKVRLSKCSGKFFSQAKLQYSNVDCWLPYLAEYYNIFPNSCNYTKTYDLGPPNLTNLDHKLAYIVGFLDGDGSISNKNVFRLCFYGTEQMLRWIVDTLYENENHKKYFKPLAVSKARKSYSVSATHQRGIAIYRRLLDINIEYRLKRKWNLNI